MRCSTPESCTLCPEGRGSDQVFDRLRADRLIRNRERIRAARERAVLNPFVKFSLALAAIVLVGLAAQQWRAAHPYVPAPPEVRLACIEGYVYGYVGGQAVPIPLFERGRPRACPDAGEYELPAPELSDPETTLKEIA